MTRHYANRKPPVTPRGPWAKASYGFTWGIEELADRDDLVVKVAPDAGFDDSAYDANGELIVYTQEMVDAGKAEITEQIQNARENGAPTEIMDALRSELKHLDDMVGKPVGQQHPGVTFPSLGIVEINPKYLPDEIREHPETMEPLSYWDENGNIVPHDRERYPVAWGLLSHEASHANYSKWMEILNEQQQNGRNFSEEENRWAGAATLLEESRIESRQMRRRPQDQKWLQASGMRIALDEVSSGVKATKKYIAEHPELAGQLDLDKVRLSRAAALVMARIDAGSVEENPDTDEIEQMIRSGLGDEEYDRLRDIWREAHVTADDDYETMLELGRRWYEITGDSGQDDGYEEGEGEGSEGNNGNADGDQLSKAIGKAARNSEKEANGEANKERRRARIQDRANKQMVEAQARKQAKQKANSVFAGEAQPVGHPVTGYRNPTVAEISLARATRRKLQAAYVPERAVAKVQRALPPGRLSMRSAQQLEAQKDAGLLPDVEPFTYKDRRHVVTPPLKVGIIQDVSGSQDSAAAAAVSGAWSLVRATTMIEDAEVAMVTFGNAVHKIVGPHERMPKVPVINASAGTQYFLDSIKAIEGVLNLTKPGSARLLVILTDGYLAHRDIQGRDAALKRLTDYGVKVLWMVTDGSGDVDHVPGKIPGVHVFRKASGQYDVIPRVITDEAVNALKK